jgi:hypothetical protein
MLQNKKSPSVKLKRIKYFKIVCYFASKILKTALQQMKAPIKRITHDTIDKIVESKAKRKNTPIILTITPTAINIYIGV